MNGGIGSQAKALERLKVNFEHWKYVDFDKYAVNSYNAIFQTNFEPTDITKIHATDLEIKETDKYCYIMTYSFPCQDLSLAGKQKGMSKGDNTRSGLLWEVERLLNECVEFPQILLMENVPEVVGQKNIEDFNKWQTSLEKLGYKNYLQILNAKDYSIPQNRRRCFMVSILGNYSYTFPQKQKLNLRLKDLLEDEVDEKYYLSEKMIKNILTPAKEKWSSGKMEIDLDIARPLTATMNKMHRADTDNYISSDSVIKVGNVNPSNNGMNGNIYLSTGLSPTLTTNKGEGIKMVIRKYGIFDTKESIHQAGSVYNQEGLSPTLTTMEGGWRQPCIEVLEGTKKGYAEAYEGDSINLSYLDSATRRGRVGKQMSQTLTTQQTIGVYENSKIRKLTPLECWRLMGFDDEDFYKAEKVNSNSQLYKQAGNSICVSVLEAIFKELF